MAWIFDKRRICRSMKTIKLHKVEIDWWDSYATLGTWHHAEDALKTKTYIAIKTLGFMYKEEKDRVHVAMSAHFEGKEITRLGALFTIPRGCIKKITYIK